MLIKLEFKGQDGETVKLDVSSPRDLYVDVEPGVEVAFIPNLDRPTGKGYILERRGQTVTLLEEIGFHKSHDLNKMSYDGRLAYFKSLVAARS